AGAPSPPRPAGRFDAVLLVGGANVLIGRRTLGAMGAALAAGAPEVRPSRLSETRLAGGDPIYTLRGYERLERLFLAGDVPPPAATAPPPPVALVSRERWERAAGDPATLLAGDARDAARAGLCHEFIDYYGEVRADVLPFVPAGAREVLEVGCGRGVTGRLLQERLGCRVTGVELNPLAAREAARHLDRVVQGDVEELEIDGTFDVVLALELVEHLVESEAFLARLPRLLAPGGRAVLSVPNVGHWAVAEDLLAGRWDYLPIGLLCYTHYRFFTRRTLEDWLRRAGLERFTLHPQRTELPERFSRLASPFEIDRESLATKGFYVVVEG
ncbi:MAG TPA: class I SAM-dependent methyltransferase, partial [Thermoanaerobaculia bacterium]|nr:class I SAM-dependent methyltransferase [Thermoanaerobaculia bacterium]